MIHEVKKPLGQVAALLQTLTGDRHLKRALGAERHRELTYLQQRVGGRIVPIVDFLYQYYRDSSLLRDNLEQVPLYSTVCEDADGLVRLLFAIRQTRGFITTTIPRALIEQAERERTLVKDQGGVFRFHCELGLEQTRVRSTAPLLQLLTEELLTNALKYSSYELLDILDDRRALVLIEVAAVTNAVVLKVKNLFLLDKDKDLSTPQLRSAFVQRVTRRPLGGLAVLKKICAAMGADLIPDVLKVDWDLGQEFTQQSVYNFKVQVSFPLAPPADAVEVL